MTNKINPNLTKEQIYEKLLKPFRHRKEKVYDFNAHRYRVSYFCEYEGCGKEFNKTWNLLDHVRMHVGIRPYECNICHHTFTQKGNLKKHNLIQHSHRSLKERKRFKCKTCNKRYTERYNLVVSLIIRMTFFY